MTRRRAVIALGLLSILLASLSVLGLSGEVAAASGKQPQVSIGDVTVTETDSAGVVATFDVTLAKGEGEKVKVWWSTQPGSASTADFTAASGKVVFKGPQKKQTEHVQVAVTGDDLVESDETFQVVLTKVKGGKAKKAAGAATITNDDTNHTLVVVRSGSGTGTVSSAPPGIVCGADCSESYSSNAVVTLTATPGAGSSFTGWSGACSGTGSCQVSMADDRGVIATFTPFPTLTVATAGSGTVTSSLGGISCPSDCAEDYPPGTVVTLSATPSTGFHFTGWSGGGCSGTGTCVVTLSSSTSVTATFAINTYALTVTLSQPPGSSGHVNSSAAGINCPSDCTETYTHGTTVTLTASAGSGWAFQGWSGGGCAGMGTCVVTMTQAQNVTASFNSL